MTPEEAERYDALKDQIAQLKAQLAQLRSDSFPCESSGGSAQAEEQSEVLWTFDRVLRRFTYVNPRVEKLFGMRVGQALTAGPDQTSNPETYRRMVDAFDVLYQDSNVDAMKPRQGLRNEDMRVYVRNLGSGESQVANYIVVAQQIGPDGMAIEIAGIYFKSVLSVSGENGAMRALESWEKLFAALPLPMFVLGIDMRVRCVNQAMLQALGLEKAEDCVGQACYRLVHHMNSPHPQCPLMPAMEQNTFVRATIEEPALGGSYSFHTVPVGEEGMLPTCALCVMCNVTSICENHHVLTEELARQSLAQQTGGFGIWSIPIDRTHKVSDFTPMMLTPELYELLHIDRKRETSFRPVVSFWQRVMSREDYAKLMQILMRLVGGEIPTAEFNFQRIMLQATRGASSNAEHYCLKAVCRFTSEGYPSQIIGIVQDVSTSEELRGKITHASALLDVAYSSLIGGPFTLRIVPGKPVLLSDTLQLSAGARRLLGVVEEATATTVAVLIRNLHPNDGQILLANFIELALGSLAKVRMECRLNPAAENKQHHGGELIVQAVAVAEEDENAASAEPDEAPAPRSKNGMRAVLIQGIICNKHRR